MKPRAFVCDIDGTAADVSHREHFLKIPCSKCKGRGWYNPNPEYISYPTCPECKGRKTFADWDAFYAAMGQDPPVRACQLVVRGLIAQGITPIFLTGRPCRYMERTRNWLTKHRFISYTEDGVNTHLYMRPDEDHCPDHELKARVYRETIEPRWDVVVWLEDRDSVVRMVRQDLGLPCWQVRPGDF